jgi:hypothetical protein
MLAGELQEHPMCDYSLEHIASRPAAVADRLISTNFHNTITRGFSAAGDLDTAICLRPGTEIAFDQEPRYEHPVTHQICLAPSRVARFRQINIEMPYAHHDALEFADGAVVLVARLIQGQWATVLQLPSATPEKSEPVAKARQFEPSQVG